MKKRIFGLLLLPLVLGSCTPSKKPSNTAPISEDTTEKADTDQPSPDIALEEEGNLYAVTVLDEKEAPVSCGVQLCTDTYCRMPVSTDENGQVSLRDKEGKFYVHLYGLEEDKLYNPNLTLTKDAPSLTLHVYTVKDVYTLKDPKDDTISETGAYQIELKKDEERTLKLSLKKGSYFTESYVPKPVGGDSGAMINPSVKVGSDEDDNGGKEGNFKLSFSGSETSITFKADKDGTLPFVLLNA